MKKKIENEKDYIISSWQKHFAGKCDKKIAIYGIGKNTEIILDNFNSDNIIGLLDGVRKEAHIYNKPIISIEEAVSAGVSIIVIIARYSNLKIIYRRIADLCLNNFIEVYDINGNIIECNEKEEKSFNKYKSINEKYLKEKIKTADIISFDIFDTLVTRRVLYPHDIFSLIQKKGILGFEKLRINAETDLRNEEKIANIYDIYERLGDNYSPELEIETEAELLVIRKAIVDMLDYALSEGKIVYLVSDMYLPKRIIKNLLDPLGIKIDEKYILISCDYSVSKCNGLFYVLRKKAGNKKTLHIGDDFEADIKSAKRFGIDDTFKIESGLTMLEDSYASGLLIHDKSLSNRLIIGEFVSKQLNDPFLFNRTGGLFEVKTNYDMSYSFIAPLLSCFFTWMIKKSQELGLNQILLCSRDGYIFEKMYQLIKNKYDLPVMKYFYTSRAVAVIASLIDESDIIHAYNLPFTGTTEEMLLNRFCINKEDIRVRQKGEIDRDYILRHKDIILKIAEQNRANYIEYINSSFINSDSRAGLFDFVSQGTCQKALANIVDFDLYGLYFALIDPIDNYKENTPIEAMFGKVMLFADNTYNFTKNYFSLENLLSSFEPTLSCFNGSAAPQFFNEERTKADLAVLKECHEAILNYFECCKIDNLIEVDKEVVDCIFSYIQPRFCCSNIELYVNIKLQDEFCNR